MTIIERRKKLAQAEKTLKSTRRRLRRLQTSERMWQTRVMYHARDLAILEAEEKAASRFALPQTQGRKFR